MGEKNRFYPVLFQINGHITSYLHPGNITKALNGEHAGTIIHKQ